MLRARVAQSIAMSSSSSYQFLFQNFSPPSQCFCSTKPLIPYRSLTITSPSSLNSKLGLSNAMERSRLWSRISVGVRAASSESGSIDSSMILSMENKIKEQLNAEKVIVKDAYGDGRHVSIYVVSDAFEGQSAVNRQRMVYKAIWEELQSTVHAVDNMVTHTPSEAK